MQKRLHFLLGKKRSLKRIKALTLHFLYTMKRNPTRLIEIIVWPSFEILLFALLATSVEQIENTYVKTGLLLLSGIIFWDFFSRIVQETISQFLDDVNSKNIQNILITPLSQEELLIGLSIASFLKMIVSSIFLLLIILIIYPTVFLSFGLISFLWITILILYGISISTFGIALLFIFGQKFSFIGSFLSTFVQIFACVFYARDVLAEPAKLISYLIPPSYIFESMRKYIIFNTANLKDLIIPFALTMLTGIIGMFVIKISYKKSKKIATLTKI